MKPTITPEYAELNRKLHERDDYGTGSFRWSDKVRDLKDDTGSISVLDYGCGKGYLRQSLGNPDWLREYDPAVPGKDAKPRLADVVVCTDVLEHIEPELLDNVLLHIAALAQKAVFLSIAIRPSTKFLADGRNAHLIVQSAGWWREKLEKKFLIHSWESGFGEVVMIGSTVRKIGEIKSKSAVTETIRYEQAIRNCALVKERVGWASQHEGRVAVVAYGPSLRQTWHELVRERKVSGAKIVTVSGAHDFLIERGIVPDYHVEVDPREHKAWFTRNSHSEVTYWPASCCHPVLIDNLIDHKRKIALWHVFNSDDDMKIIAPDGPDPDGALISGGGSVGCRAFNLMFSLGYRSFSMYGMDCSYAMTDGAQHAGAHSGKLQSEWRVRVGNPGRWFRSSGNMVYTARGFMANYLARRRECETNNEPFIAGTSDRMEIFFHGDGLLQEMAVSMNSGQKAA